MVGSWLVLFCPHCDLLRMIDREEGEKDRGREHSGNVKDLLSLLNTKLATTEPLISANLTLLHSPE